MNDIIKKIPRAVILAAGSGKRFLRSGGEGYKQLTPYKGEPVIARLVRQVHESGLFDRVQVVLGSDVECRSAIIDALFDMQVDYLINLDSENDNNLLSFRVGVDAIDQPVLLIESDCVVETRDIAGMIHALHDNEIRWAHIGDVSDFDYGGLVEIDSATGLGVGVAVLSKSDFSSFKASGREGVKMFGLTAFGAKALKTYRDRIDALDDRHNKYFHHIAIHVPKMFRITTYRVGSKCFSFNTICEVKKDE